MEVPKLHSVGVVVIGRNEGHRLTICLQSVLDAAPGAFVYVDSGSSDDSLQRAQALGFPFIRLDGSAPFTAARGRNAGAKYLLEKHPQVRFIQFVDGDCLLERSWMEVGKSYLDSNASYAAVAGRRRERYPGASMFNRICDIEWNTPVGDAREFGGDMICRAEAYSRNGGYDEQLIAAEDSDFCLRLRLSGWKLRRLPDAMTQHDANIHHIAQWWKRTERAGFAYAANAVKHRKVPGRPFAKQVRSALFWGVAFPVLVVVLSIYSPWMLLVAGAVLLLQILKVYRYVGSAVPGSFLYAVTAIAGKVPEAVGALRCLFRSVARRPAQLIEYK